MAAGFCSFCGKPVPPAATFCPSCGAAVARSYAPPGTSAPGAPNFAPSPPLAGGWPPPPSPYAPAPPSRPAQSPERNRRALEAIQIAAVIALVGFGLSAATLVLTPVGQAFSTTTSGTGANTTVHLHVDLIFVDGLIAVGGVLTLLELGFYRSGFRTLAEEDPRFRTPATLTIVAMIGYAMLLLGAAVLINDLVQAVNSCSGGASNGTLTSGCLFTGSFWGSLALIGVGAIVALVGFIGLLIGIWRLGDRFDDSLFKVGAVLSIFPFLQIIGAILILVGAHSGLARLGRANPYAPRSF